MRITCPHCGLRDLAEFTYQGDATRRAPALDASAEAWYLYVYSRANPAGAHREFWQHSGGCRMHIIVERDTLTHVIASAMPVRTGMVPMEGKPAKKSARKAKP